jgi:monofunctional biosynthetic peptidoglycan transglycosylase
MKKLTFIAILLAVSFSLPYFILMSDLSKLKKENPGKTSFMKYRENEFRKKGKKFRINQVWVPLSRVSPYLVKAVLIGEDDKFWRHEGFDYEAIEKAIEKDIKAKRFKLGGSTISQQLAKNLYLSPSKNLFRKAAEAFITWRMEKVLSKRRILEIYLNVVEWGEGIFGAEAASQHYFGKSSSDLSPEDAARLAAVLPNPRRYNAAGEQGYVVRRSSLIYSIMVRRGIVIPEYSEVTEESGHPSEDGMNPVGQIENQKPAE